MIAYVHCALGRHWLAGWSMGTMRGTLTGVLAGAVVDWALLLSTMQTGHLAPLEVLLSAGTGVTAGVMSGLAWYTRRHPQPW